MNTVHRISGIITEPLFGWPGWLPAQLIVVEVRPDKNKNVTKYVVVQTAGSTI